MGMNQTPASERVHISFFGKRNAGKSSVINAVTGQDLAIVSSVMGTTTDPVYKSMELLPLGPVVVIDTPGIDDEGELGALRVRKSYQVLNKTDIAILVVDSTTGKGEEEFALLHKFHEKHIPYLVVYNKIDLLSVEKIKNLAMSVRAGEVLVSAADGMNIQELKDHEQELIESRELAEQAELKQSFLNNMSQEIRTPLNAIVGFSDMLANEPEFSDEERQEFVDIINTNTKLLLKLVGDVLELSRIESGNLSFIFQRESVRQLLDDVYQTHSLLIQPPLQFLKDFPPEDVQVNVDPMRLTQVLTNFLNNANKFTKEGSIQLGYCCPSGMSEVHLYVEDTGIGIPHSEQKMIFERFYKRSEFSQGVGLGLSICVLIVEKMGGRIELRSEEGRGSRFTVVLPCIE